MNVLINAGFNEAVGQDLLLEFKKRGFSGIRQDLLQGGDHLKELIWETGRVGMPSLFIVRDENLAVEAARALRGQPSQGLELGNEEDSKQTPKAYHRWLVRVSAVIRAVNPTVPIWTAGITAHDSKRLGWLEEVYSLGVPGDIGCGLHGYAQELPPNVPRPGFESRAEEFKVIRRIIGTDRAFACSEIGWHVSKFKVKKGWFNTVTRQWTDEQVAAFLQEELNVLKNAGARFATVFQSNCGPKPDYYEDNFGIRRFDGSWKPQAAAVTDWVGRNL